MRGTTAPDSAIRLLLAGMPGLTAAPVHQCIRGQPDISIIGEILLPEDVVKLVACRSCDVVLTARTASGVPEVCQRVVFGDVAVPVIAIDSDGRLEIYDRRIVREAELDQLLTEIRRVAHPVEIPQR